MQTYTYNWKNQIYSYDYNHQPSISGRLAQSVTCLATDTSLTADPGVASSISARSHSFVEIDHKIISTVILLPSAESFKKGCCFKKGVKMYVMRWPFCWTTILFDLAPSSIDK